LQQIRPGVGEAALSWFYAPNSPPVEARLAMLINDLALIDETFVLVLDDIHCIHAPAVYKSLTFFIENLPPNMHLILTSRSDLPLPRARWRAGRRLVEFDNRDLRFSPGESAEFLHAGMGLALTPEQIAALVDRTEGWVAGLQLVALALQALCSKDLM
jgi:LuxR family maltose regulon positive regulatory protein